MKDAQKPDHISLNTLVSRLKEGRFVIPDFQREFEWKPWDIRDLMRSIFLDYYIGSLLLWKGKDENFDALSCEDVYGFSGDGKREHIVLDGQQRLTAMNYAFTAPEIPLPSRSNPYYYFIHVDRFMAEEYDEAFDYDWNKKRRKTLTGSSDYQYREHIFPLSVIGAGGWDLPNWVQGYEAYWKEQAAGARGSGDEEREAKAMVHAENARAFGEHLQGITQQYQISYIELDREIGVDKVCDIFTQINSKGVRLDVFDLINALLKPKGLQLKHMWREAKTRLEFVESDKLNVYLLQVMSILRQSYCSPKYLYFLLPGQEKPIRESDGTRRKEVLVPSIADFEKQWDMAVDAMEDSIRVLSHPQEYGAISSKYLPYPSILPAFSAIRQHVRSVSPNRQMDAQRKIRHWYWASVFTSRYSGSVESTTARDFLDLKDWIEDEAAQPGLIAEFSQRFRNLELRKETNTGSSVYKGIFNLLVLKGARDWMTSNVPHHDELDDHHIVPISRAKDDLGIKGDAIHTILNRTPLTADTNRNVIGSRLPNQYLPDLIEANGETTVRAIMESHLISGTALDILLRDPFGTEDFEAFISERQRTIQEAIENLLIKERLDLSPHLRELDEQVEQTELAIRSLIERTLNGDPSELPPHLLQKLDEKIARAAKKDASFDSNFHDTLAGKLEFSDLRELQDAIQSKSLWPRFELRFKNKEALATKFGQLAEMRNSIRHSRTLSEIARKEGEAALLWFEDVLKG
ncbi:MAG: DUF262 domain-containing protein [Verrucomicrobiae bacterium]|nr:DUF262 domain-containing protein [Verrucomicrobiae bacterium]